MYRIGVISTRGYYFFYVKSVRVQFKSLLNRTPKMCWYYSRAGTYHACTLCIRKTFPSFRISSMNNLKLWRIASLAFVIWIKVNKYLPKNQKVWKLQLELWRSWQITLESLKITLSKYLFYTLMENRSSNFFNISEKKNQYYQAGSWMTSFWISKIVFKKEVKSVIFIWELSIWSIHKAQ